MEEVEYDFDNICRVCREYSRSLFYIFGEGFDEMLMACTNVVVKIGDGLPHSLCLECADKLDTAYTFKQLCESTDVYFQDYLKAKELRSKLDQEEIKFNAAELEHLSDIEDVEFSVESDIEYSTTTGDSIKLLKNKQLLVTCRVCEQCFSTLDDLKKHECSDSNDFICDICGKQYSLLYRFEQHKLGHTENKVYLCKICAKAVTSLKHIKRHLMTHLKKKPFACNTCNRAFNRPEYLTTHIKRCNGEFCVTCDICNKSCKTEDSLKEHERLHKTSNSNALILDNLDNIHEYYIIVQKEEDGLQIRFDRKESDDECQTVTEAGDDTRPELNVTEVAGDDTQPELNVVENKSQDLEKAAMKPNNNVNKICNATRHETNKVDSSESRKRRLEIDEQSVVLKLQKVFDVPVQSSVEENGDIDPLGSFICPVLECSEVFTRMSLLEKHSMQHDNTLGLQDSHTCSDCAKPFPTFSQLTRHMLSHSQVKAFACQECKKRFNRKDQLVQHLKIHSTNEAFECDICTEHFNRVDHLTSHMALKHGIGEMKYQCVICLKSFATETYRDMHINSHKLNEFFSCHICKNEQLFTSQSLLMEHLKIHAKKIKKHVCPACNQCFMKYDNLISHVTEKHQN